MISTRFHPYMAEFISQIILNNLYWLIPLTVVIVAGSFIIYRQTKKLRAAREEIQKAERSERPDRKDEQKTLL